MKYELRPYQKEASDAAVEFFNSKEKKNSIIVVPTGGGKSIILADIARQLNGNVLVLQPNKEILEQNFSKLKSYGVEDCAIYSASLNKKEIDRITFATIGSIINHKEDFNKFKAVIIDECHVCNASGGMYKDFLTHVKRKVLGFTATPYRLYSQQRIIVKDQFLPNGSFKETDYMKNSFEPKPGVTLANRCIEKFLTRTRPRIFNDVIYQVSIQQLLTEGFLARLTYFPQLKLVDTNRVKVNSTGRDYDEQSLSDEFKRCNLTERLAEIVNRLLHPKNGVPRNGILVFTKFVEESEALCRAIPNCAYLTGETNKKDRERIINDFKSGKIKVLSNVGILTCLSKDTEILTRNKGWVGIDEIEDNDLVAQYDENDETITFAKPIRIIKKEFDEDFVKVEGRYMNFKVTHDHNMLYRKRSIGKLSIPKKCKAEELTKVKNPYIPVSGYADPDSISVQQKSYCSDKRFIATNSYNYRKKGMTYDEALNLAKEMLVKRNSRRCKNPDEISLDECRFIGFWLGDGCVYNSGEGKRYSVSQSCCNPNMIRWLEALLERCGIHYNKQYYNGNNEAQILGKKCKVNAHITYNLAIGTGGYKQSVDSNLYSLLPYLQKEGSDLYWGFNREQYFCIMEGYFKANGWHGDNKEYSGQCAAGASKSLFDLLQAIGVCRGYRVSVLEIKPKKWTKHTLYKISLGDYRYHQMVLENASVVHNIDKQQVWCVTMPKGTIITRRNGRVAIMGNCGFDYPALDTIVLARPTMSLALYYQMIGRIIRPFQGKQGWVVDLCGNVERFGEVENFHLVENKPGEYAYMGYVQEQWKYLTNVYY